MKVELTRAALADLDAISAFISDDDAKAAARIGRRLLEACEGLALLSNRGKPGLIPGTREISTVRPYVIVYRETATAVQILRVWHGAQDRRI
jgi:plasmid stabilization system protein ParE